MTDPQGRGVKSQSPGLFFVRFQTNREVMNMNMNAQNINMRKRGFRIQYETQSTCDMLMIA